MADRRTGNEHAGGTTSMSQSAAAPGETLFESADLSVPAVVAAFDFETRELLSRGAFRSLAAFREALEAELRAEELRVAEVEYNVNGFCGFTVADRARQPVRQYLYLTTQQLPEDWREKRLEEPPLAVFGLQYTESGVPRSGFPVGAFTSRAEMERQARFAEAIFKGFEAAKTFVLAVPFTELR